jgi:hypothetical protein
VPIIQLLALFRQIPESPPHGEGDLLVFAATLLLTAATFGLVIATFKLVRVTQEHVAHSKSQVDAIRGLLEQSRQVSAMLSLETRDRGEVYLWIHNTGLPVVGIGQVSRILPDSQPEFFHSVGWIPQGSSKELRCAQLDYLMIGEDTAQVTIVAKILGAIEWGKTVTHIATLRVTWAVDQKARTFSFVGGSINAG